MKMAPGNQLAARYNANPQPTYYKAGSESQRHGNYSPQGREYTIFAPLEGRTFQRFVGTEPQQLLIADSRRRGMLIQNLGADTVFFAFGVEPSGNVVNGHPILPGQSYEAQAWCAPVNDVYIVADSAASAPVQVAVSEFLLVG